MLAHGMETALPNLVFRNVEHSLHARLEEDVAGFTEYSGECDKPRDRRHRMLSHDTQSDGAEAVFRHKFRQKLAARGYQGAELDRKVDELMTAPVRFRLDLDEAPSTRDAQQH